jgi:anti-sigma factor RsiW
MNRYDCETIRDQLPALVRGEMLPHEAARVEQHLDECDACRAEEKIVRLLHATLAPVPVGLEARVIAAVRRRAGRRIPERLALAATVAAAVLGTSFFVQRMQESRATPDLNAVSWAAAEDPLLHGRSELHQLSVEELELLLAELDQ